ncbi:MAG: ATP synthase F1 subunit gamma [bacterium]
MSTLRDTLRRINSIRNTAKITSAMKMIAATHLRQAQKLRTSAQPYFNNLDGMLKRIVPLIDESYQNPLLDQRDVIKNVGIMVISSDKGLCGSFNSNLFKFTQNVIKTLPEIQAGADYKVITLGNKVSNFYSRYSPEKVDFAVRPIYGQYRFAFVKEIMHKVVESYRSGKYDKIYFIYTDFVNILKQEPKITQLLPMVIEKSEVPSNSNYIFEPSKTQILDDLIPMYVDEVFWKLFLASNQALRAAEMMAMDLATNNAHNFIKFLELQYNKERQQIITTEMLEIVSGAEALK